MSPRLKSLGIDRLSVDERIDLAQEIWESIDEESHAPLLGEAQRQELERRLEEHDVRPDDVVSRDEIRDGATRRFHSS